MSEISVGEVFVPGGMPDITYVKRTSVSVESDLGRLLGNTSKFISVTGMTKSGKTVMVSRLCPREKTIWFDGGSYESEEDFWAEICGQLDVYQTISTGRVEKEGLNGEVALSGKVGFIASLQAKLSTFFQNERSQIETRKVSSKSKAISTLRIRKTPLIIDDFHYISGSEQKKILRALKPLVFLRCPIVLISIPHRKNDALKAERELTGRTELLQIPIWEEKELFEIASRGFEKLKIIVKREDIEKLTREANGSPHLMQEFCLGICTTNKIIKELEKSKEISLGDVSSLFLEIAERNGRPVFDRLKQGPRSRTDRKVRVLSNSEKTDIYGVVLYSLMQLKPGLDLVNYESIRSSIRGNVIGDPPQMQEVSRVLDHMSRISIDDNASAPVLDWEKDGRLHITDPFFSFFLKWGSFKE